MGNYPHDPFKGEMHKVVYAETAEEILRRLYGFRGCELQVVGLASGNVARVVVDFAMQEDLEYFKRIVLTEGNPSFTNVWNPHGSTTLVFDLTIEFLANYYDVNSPSLFFDPVDPALIAKHGGVNTLIGYFWELLDDALIDGTVVEE